MVETVVVLVLREGNKNAIFSALNDPAMPVLLFGRSVETMEWLH